MPVMGGRAGCSCAASGRQTEHRTSERVTRIMGCPKDFDMERDSPGSGSLVRSWMRAGEFGTAGLFLGREFHELDASVVGIVEIELPFAVATNLGFLARFPAVLDKLLLGCVDVRYSERDVVHHAEGVLAGVG